MTSVLIRHKVKDYTAWKAAFDEHGTARKAAGSKGGRLFRNSDDPSELLILLELDGIDRAREFIASDDLRQAMERAGVTDRPDVYFLEETDRPAE